MLLFFFIMTAPQVDETTSVNTNLTLFGAYSIGNSTPSIFKIIFLEFKIAWCIKIKRIDSLFNITQLRQSSTVNNSLA